MQKEIKMLILCNVKFFFQIFHARDFYLEIFLYDLKISYNIIQNS